MLKKLKTPEEELADFCDNLKPGGFAYFGPLHTLRASNKLFGFVVRSELVQDTEKYITPAEFPEVKIYQPRLFRDTVLAISRDNGLFTAKEILSVVSKEAAISISPMAKESNIALKMTCECPPTSWEREIPLPLNISAFGGFQEIVLRP